MWTKNELGDICSTIFIKIIAIFKLYHNRASDSDKAGIEIISIVSQFIQVMHDEGVIDMRVLIAALWHENPEEFWSSVKTLIMHGIKNDDNTIIKAMWAIAVPEWYEDHYTQKDILDSTPIGTIIRREDKNMKDSIAEIAAWLSKYFTSNKYTEHGSDTDTTWLWKSRRKSKRTGGKATG